MAKHKKFSMQPVLVDIVIPVYRKFDFLQKTLDSVPLAANGITYKIWIYDNGSPEEEKSFYLGLKDRTDITVIQNLTNVGFPAGCNRGAKRGNAPLIFFLNDDVVLTENSLFELVKELDDPSVGVAGMKLIFPDGTPHGPAGKVQHVGIEFNVRAEAYHQFISWSPDNPKVLAKRNAAAVTGAALLTRRNLWKTIGGFYEDYQLGTWEDVDYCIQVRKLGYNITVSQAIGYHWVGATASSYGFSYPLGRNRNLFLSRFGNDLMWEEWKYW